MLRLLLLAGFLLLMPYLALAQLECDVTKQLDENDFVSAFRNAYIDMFTDNRGFNLVKEARTVFERATFNKVNNVGDTCIKRYGYTLDLCLSCVRKLGWRADSELFRKRRVRQRNFINDLRRRVCVDDDACKRKPRPSPSPIPGLLVKIVSSDETVSKEVAYRFALVAEATGDEAAENSFSTRLVYSVEDLATGLGAFGDTIIETRSSRLDVHFFECAGDMLDRAGLGDLAAAAIRETCYDASNFNNDCANERLSAEVCDGLRLRGCVPLGDSLISHCL